MHANHTRFALALLPLLAACGGGDWVVTTWGEEYIEEGIPSAEFEDGCEAVFDTFTVALTEAALLDGDGEVAGSVETGSFEMTEAGPQTVGTASVAATHYDTARFVVAPAGGPSVRAAGTLTCGGDAVSFDWSFETSTTYLCEPADLTVPAGGEAGTELDRHEQGPEPCPVEQRRHSRRGHEREERLPGPDAAARALPRTVRLGDEGLDAGRRADEEREAGPEPDAREPDARELVGAEAAHEGRVDRAGERVRELAADDRQREARHLTHAAPCLPSGGLERRGHGDELPGRERGSPVYRGGGGLSTDREGGADHLRPGATDSRFGQGTRCERPASSLRRLERGTTT